VRRCRSWPGAPLPLLVLTLRGLLLPGTLHFDF